MTDIVPLLSGRFISWPTGQVNMPEITTMGRVAQGGKDGAEGIKGARADIPEEHNRIARIISEQVS
ncbi:hypothetical protein GGI1_12203 [Acidithiobacillus sp. GGI-221]|nr:hypothetical protein GGI1_12203 [Acidithiobacillus sp. GGI-221]